MCRGKASEVLAGLAGPWFKSKSGVHSGRLFSILQNMTTFGRSPLIVSGYANPLKNSYLKEALYSVINKLVFKKVMA